MKEIAVLYICIGKYSVLWPEFYESSQKYLFTSSNVHYFVYTDSVDLIESLNNSPNVTCIEEKNYGWPGNTLFRFRMFLGIKEWLQKFDYIYFFNANALFVTNVDEDILPNDKELVVAEHFAMRNIDPILFEYDRNKKSKAYVQYGKEGGHYVQAAMIGGATDTFLSMCHECSLNIEEDFKEGVIARWHDESHLNKYILGRKIKLLPSIYIYPEALLSKIDNSNVKILMRDKTKYASLTVLRYGRRSLLDMFLEKLEFQRRKLEKYFYLGLKHFGMLR